MEKREPIRQYPDVTPQGLPPSRDAHVTARFGTLARGLNVHKGWAAQAGDHSMPSWLFRKSLRGTTRS